MAHMVFGTKFKAEMEGLDEPPFDSDFGQKIYKNVSKKSWGEWVERQKMLLNEYRLQPWTREAQEFLVEQMNEFFFGAGGAAEGVCGADALESAAGGKAAWSCTLRSARYPAVARLGDGQQSRDVAQPGRAHPWGG